jgi:hypothetical protein
MMEHNSRKSSKNFKSQVFGSSWDQFVEQWAPVAHQLVLETLGPYGTEPLPLIKRLPVGAHSSGATASFNMMTGQVHLCTSIEGRPGQTLEKLTHEFLHGSLSQFPEGDPFYEEGYVDYSTWVLAQSPVWGEHKEAMIQAASYNIAQRRERALKGGNDYDRKRWAGGVHAMMAYGPWLLSTLLNRKNERSYVW